MNNAEAMAAIRRSAQTDHATLLLALNLLLDDKVVGMRQLAARADDLDGQAKGYALAHHTCAGHVEEALQEAFGIWPGVDDEAETGEGDDAQ